ncbi:hypothetical protein ABFS82_06G043300 [Erythranthe guttata]|uniref:DUF7963 domain-containing protein n=1 Tax=Erythranthe guttata TaxID=4155 RepID=A0A022QBL9_ERYGU|nr:PREDICTED: uncharacterized protein LOC105971911 [Erythranthe guttata]EYU24999.1 hypothetical protein MIMGU_mgv1a021610mg [Erythranthe guttata]|eukprot:XP_012852293.1 PREDICTED: uncharacterized protein LOC105971911 [Erythranthe guttata]
MSNPNPNSTSIDAAEDSTVKAVNKRYEGLVTVRTKAVKGKGAWYWAHLEPILIRNPETNAPKAVKLKCGFCDAAFSASNPSRTATEHLKRGTCPNFTSPTNPISQLPPLSSPKQNHRKRSSQSQQSVSPSLNASPINTFDPSRCLKPPVLLSGGRDDFRPLALLEDSVKKLKTPKASSSSPAPTLSKHQIKTAFDFLADWFYESCGSVSFSSLEHPKFKAFLDQVGLPAVSKTEFSTARLDSKFEIAKAESEARIRDASFFQIASNGWNSKNFLADKNQCLVNFTVNLPNGLRIFQKAVYSGGGGGTVPPQYVEEVLWETAAGICGGDARRCVGFVVDKYKSSALKNLELENHWMVNLPCQLQGFLSLIKDFYRELPLFRNVGDSCTKIANLVNSMPQIRNIFSKIRLQGVAFASYIRVPPNKCDVSKNLSPFIGMLDDLLSCSRILHLIVLDDSYRDVCSTDDKAREVADVIQDVRFWNDVSAAHSLVKIIMGMTEEIEAERPLIGQCLPLWEELRAKVKGWCSKYSFVEGPVEEIVERRFRKNYHPAMSAAFILDPLYLVRDLSGKYLPPFKCLTNEQEKDVDKIVTRLVSSEEAHVAVMELMKWRSEGLDPLYARAVQVRQRDPQTGKMKVANPQSSRLVWETCLKEFRSLGKVAVRLLFLHATSCGVKYDFALMRSFCGKGVSGEDLERVQKMVFVAAHAKIKNNEPSDEVLDDTSSPV